MFFFCFSGTQKWWVSSACASIHILHEHGRHYQFKIQLNPACNRASERHSRKLKYILNFLIFTFTAAHNVAEHYVRRWNVLMAATRKDAHTVKHKVSRYGNVIYIFARRRKDDEKQSLTQLNALQHATLKNLWRARVKTEIDVRFEMFCGWAPIVVWSWCIELCVTGKHLKGVITALQNRSWSWIIHYPGRSIVGNS